MARRLEEEGVATWRPAGSSQELRITPAGRALIEGEPSQPEKSSSPSPDRDIKRPITINTQESPLAWLRSRRDKSGQPMIDAASFEAGERFRNDLAMSGILPRVTADWSTIARGSGWRGGLLPSEALTSARQRVRKTLDAVGPEFSGLLIDLCGFLKGLETIERERQWPPRSAKIPIQMALAALARHYGFGSEARGPSRSHGIRRWKENEAPTGQGATILQMAEYRPEAGRTRPAPAPAAPRS